MDAFVGAIFSFGFNFAPANWAQCNGQLLPISQNEALYSLIGTTYGGDGVTTFGLPNLQGRTPIGTGQGAGLPNYAIGQSAGNENITLTIANLPPHNHPVVSANIPVNGGAGDQNAPAGNVYAMSDNNVANTYNTTSDGTLMAAVNTNTGVTGSGIPISVLSPLLVINYCISLYGIYPSRN